MVKFLIPFINAVVAVLVAAVLAAAVRFGSGKKKIERHTGGWSPMDFSDL